MAIRETFPEVPIQLCLKHCRDAIRRHFTQVIPLKKTILASLVGLFEVHAMRHPWIPSEDGFLQSSEEIFSRSSHEMREFLNSVKEEMTLNQHKATIQYIEQHWYCDSMASLWMRSRKTFLPRHMTTNCIETLWSTFKRHRLAKMKMRGLNVVMNRLVGVILAQWRFILRVELARGASREVQGLLKTPKGKRIPKEGKKGRPRGSSVQYPVLESTNVVTDTANWIRSCRAYLLSGMAVCKHLRPLLANSNQEKLQRNHFRPIWGESQSSLVNVDGLIPQISLHHVEDDYEQFIEEEITRAIESRRIVADTLQRSKELGNRDALRHYLLEYRNEKRLTDHLAEQIQRKETARSAEITTKSKSQFILRLRDL